MGNEEGTDISVSMLALPTHVRFRLNFPQKYFPFPPAALLPENRQNKLGLCDLNRRHFRLVLRLLLHQHLRYHLQAVGIGAKVL